MDTTSGNTNLKWTKHIITTLISLILFLLIVPAANVSAYTYEYGWQGKAPEGSREYNSILMLKPGNIKVNQVPGTYFLNTIEGKVDGSKRIDFLFTMTSGMNNLNLSTFKKNSIEVIKIYSADGRNYDGTWNDPIAEYNSGAGKLKLDESNSFGNKDRNDPKSGQIDLYLNADTLKDGRYVLEFGKSVCGNNTDKILGHPVAFYFTVGTTVQLSELVGQVDDYLKNCVSGGDPGQYPASSMTQLKTVLEKARSLAADSSKQDQWEQAAQELTNSFQQFKQSRIVAVDSIKVKNTEQTLDVGTRGKAEAAVSVRPAESQYEKVTWVASDNITIDPDSGNFTVDYPDNNSWIKGVSAVNPSVSGTWQFKAQGESRFFTVNIPEGQNLQGILKKVGAVDITMLKVITAGNGTITATDLSYLASIKGLKGLELSQTDLKTIPENAFSGNSTLEEIYLPDSLSAIGSKAFYHCGKLSTLELPPGLESLGSSSFSGCTSLPGTVNIDAPLPPQMADSFAGSSVEGFVVPYGCGTAYKQASGWKEYSIEEQGAEKKLTVTVSKTGGLKAAAEKELDSLGISGGKVGNLTIKTAQGAQLDYATDIPYLQQQFLGATTIDLSDSKIQDDKIKSTTFKGRKSVKKFRMPEAITTIGDSAFADCTGLSDIILPESLTKIGNLAFSGCKSLPAGIVINAKKPPELVPTAIDNEIVKTFYVQGTSVAAYRAAAGWKDFSIKSQIEIAVSPSTLKIQEGTSKTLKATVSVHNGNSKTIKWSSSNTKVASVNGSGVVSARKAGSAVITAATSDGGAKATCKVTVTKAVSPKVTASVTYNSATLKWSKIAGVNGYIVYKSKSKSGTYSTLRTVSSGTTSITDTGLTTGTTYYYKVRTYKNVGGTRYLGAYSAVKAVKPVPAKPGSVKTTAGAKKITVSWKSVSGAGGYSVYRATSSNGKYVTVGTVKSGKTTKLTDKGLKAGKAYYYKVRAFKKVKSKNIYGAYSLAAYGKVK